MNIMLFPFTAIVFFALGAVMASFIGVVVARLHTGESILVGHSRCDACNVPLRPKMLVPIVSYIISGGRARCCGARISSIAPLSEGVLGVLFALAYVRIGFSLILIPLLIAFASLLALVLYDLAHQILPPMFLIVFVGASAVTGWLAAPAAFSQSIAVAFGIALFLLLIHFVSRRRAMGFADAPLAFGLALLTGPYALSGFIFSFWIGAGIGIALLAVRPRGSTMNTEVPFAPFLAAGFLLAYFTQWNIFSIVPLLASH